MDSGYQSSNGSPVFVNIYIFFGFLGAEFISQIAKPSHIRPILEGTHSTFCLLSPPRRKLLSSKLSLGYHPLAFPFPPWVILVSSLNTNVSFIIALL